MSVYEVQQNDGTQTTNLVSYAKHVKHELPIKLVSSYCLKNFSLLRLFEKQNNLFQPIVALCVETIHLICTANQMTGFYMKCNTGLKWVKFLYFFATIMQDQF